MIARWLDLDPQTYATSPLHGPDRTFRETNCYTDVWIEVLHACGIPAESAMGFTIGVDFEGDQFTFFKPPPNELRAFYGIDVHEMQLYRHIVDHAREQLAAGRTMTIEVDSWYLPDTAGTSYRQAHVKSTIVVEAIDPEAEILRYFHNAGYWQLEGEDYRGVFRLGRPFSDDVLPPYSEVVRLDAGPRLEGDALRTVARAALAGHLARRPAANPWITFGERLDRDLPLLLDGSDADYHAYAFATVRQSGAAYECARSFVDWLAPGDPDGAAASAALDRQVNGAKALLFRLARRRAFETAPRIAELAGAWDEATAALQRLAP